MDNFTYISEKIVISYLGYKPKTVAIGKNRKFNITLDPSVTEMDEIVVVGYEMCIRDSSCSAPPFSQNLP